MERCTLASPAIWFNESGSTRTMYLKGFTKEYGVHMLVWFEVHDDMENAIIREKRLKKWNREWKLRLIEEKNPEWRDLYDSIR